MKLTLPKTKENPLYHFSVDDVFDSLLEASKMESIFDHWFFKYFLDLYSKFGIQLDLYLFFQKKIGNKQYSLKDINSRVKKELEKTPWIRFGPHALNYETLPYNQSFEELTESCNLIYKEIERFAGKNSFSHYVRLHFYSEMYELEEYFKQKGVKALFSTDRDIVSYRLTDKKKDLLKERGHVNYKGMNFIRTMFRTEYLVDDDVSYESLHSQFDEKIKKKQLIVFYVHEEELKRKKVQKLTKELIKYLHSKKAISFNGI